MKKIIFINHESGITGASGVLLELVKWLKQKEYECLVIIPTNGIIEEELTKLNIPYKVVKYIKWWMKGTYKTFFLREVIKNLIRPLFLIINWFLFVTWVLREKKKLNYYDLIITNTIVIPAGIFLKILLKKPHIWYIHEYGYEDHELKFIFGRKISFYLMNKFTDIFLVNSRAVFGYYKKIFPEPKLRLLYYGVSMNYYQTSSLFPNITKNKFTCIIVGRVSKNKGQEDAILAISELKKQGINVDLWIVGEGDHNYKKHLEELILKNNIETNVKFLGFILPPFEIIKKADIGLMCSKREAFGRVTIEYMKLGKPVIASNSGANPELVKEEFNGFLYKTGDFKDLAKKIKYFYNNPEEIKRMGENAKKFAISNFNLNKFGSDFIKITKSLIK
jgi:glycosyltransferase involved in cell wall biosynthesis